MRGSSFNKVDAQLLGQLVAQIRVASVLDLELVQRRDESHILTGALPQQREQDGLLEREMPVHAMRQDADDHIQQLALEAAGKLVGDQLERVAHAELLLVLCRQPLERVGRHRADGIGASTSGYIARFRLHPYVCPPARSR